MAPILNLPHVDDLDVHRPHVWILGAGSSVAAFPKGDRNGRRLPTMLNLVETVQIAPVLEAAGIETSQDFEALYSRLASDPQRVGLTAEIENRVREYFSALELPDTPTLYDHLVLTLREKDVIATFNWDPFLVDACRRNADRGGLPHTLFLHGCVRIGVCPKCASTVDSIQDGCRRCGSPVTPVPLMYPVTNKNYSQTPFIASQWRMLKKSLKEAYILTVFGYVAPRSDVEAVSLMREAWGPAEGRNYEETEIIDIKNTEDLIETWKPFIHTHHRRIWTSFYDSTAARYPRRSCEAIWATVMENNPLEPIEFPHESSFDLLAELLMPLIAAERPSDGRLIPPNRLVVT